MKFNISVSLETLLELEIISGYCDDTGITEDNFIIGTSGYEEQFDPDNLLKLWHSLPIFITGQNSPKSARFDDCADMVVFEFN